MSGSVFVGDINEINVQSLPLKPRPRWYYDAHCADKSIIGSEQINEVFFPHQMTGSSIKMAKSICDKCLVKKDCLIDSFQDGTQTGVRAGLPPAGRDVLKKRFKRQVVNPTVIAI